MYRGVFVFLIMIFTYSLQAQESKFEVVVADSVGLEGTFEVVFQLKNASGESFEAPNFSEQFELISGPNVSSSMSFVNGEMSRSLTYTYRLKAKELGSFVIEPATIVVDGEVLESKWKKVVVAEGIANRKERRSSIFGGFDFPEMRRMPKMPEPDLEKEKSKKKKRKKKRKTYKI